MLVRLLAIALMSSHAFADNAQVVDPRLLQNMLGSTVHVLQPGVLTPERVRASAQLSRKLGFKWIRFDLDPPRATVDPRARARSLLEEDPTLKLEGILTSLSGVYQSECRLVAGGPTCSSKDTFYNPMSGLTETGTLPPPFNKKYSDDRMRDALLPHLDDSGKKTILTGLELQNEPDHPGFAGGDNILSRVHRKYREYQEDLTTGANRIFLSLAEGADIPRTTPQGEACDDSANICYYRESLLLACYGLMERLEGFYKYMVVDKKIMQRWYLGDAQVNPDTIAFADLDKKALDKMKEVLGCSIESEPSPKDPAGIRVCGASSWSEAFPFHENTLGNLKGTIGGRGTRTILNRFNYKSLLGLARSIELNDAITSFLPSSRFRSNRLSDALSLVKGTTYLELSCKSPLWATNLIRSQRFVRIPANKTALGLGAIQKEFAPSFVFPELWARQLPIRVAARARDADGKVAEVARWFRPLSLCPVDKTIGDCFRVGELFDGRSINIHPYCFGRPVTQNAPAVTLSQSDELDRPIALDQNEQRECLETKIEAYRQGFGLSPSHPIAITETGYYTTPRDANDKAAATPRMQGQLLMQSLLSLLSGPANIGQINIYTLNGLENQTDLRDFNVQSSFGLTSWGKPPGDSLMPNKDNEKLAFTLLAHLVQLMGRPGDVTDATLAQTPVLETRLEGPEGFDPSTMILRRIPTSAQRELYSAVWHTPAVHSSIVAPSKITYKNTRPKPVRVRALAQSPAPGGGRLIPTIIDGCSKIYPNRYASDEGFCTLAPGATLSINVCGGSLSKDPTTCPSTQLDNELVLIEATEQ